MKERILTGWNGARWLRLVIAVVFLVAGIKGNEPVALIAAAFFGVQAIFNVGCCGVAQCMPIRRQANAETDNITYERLN